MRLSVRERFVLGEALPPQGDFATLKIHRQLREKLSFTEEENATLKLKTTPTPDGSRMVHVWDPAGDALIGEVDIEFTPGELGIIVQTLHGLNNRKALTEQHLSLYEKFIEGQDKPAA